MRSLTVKSPIVVAITAAAGMAGAALLREDERVEKLMERVHEGRRSPYRQVQAQTEAAQPAWPVIVAALPRFEAMARALVESPDDEIKGSADGYVDAVTGLGAAARTRDPRALREAFAALEQSCGDCHYDGGVGGELEDEEDEDEEEDEDD